MDTKIGILDKYLENLNTPKDKLNMYVDKYELIKHSRGFLFKSRDKNTTKLYCTNCGSFDEISGYGWSCQICNAENEKIIDYSHYKVKKHLLDVFYIVDVIDENRFNIVRIDKTIDISKLKEGKVEEDMFVRGYIEYNYEDEDIYAYIMKVNGLYRKTEKLQDILSPIGKDFTNFNLLGFKELERCSNFYLKTGFKELKDLSRNNDRSKIYALVHYLSYNGNVNNQVELLAKAGFNVIVRNYYSEQTYDFSELLKRKGNKLTNIVRLPKNIIKLVKDFDEKEIIALEKIHHKGNNLTTEFLEYLLEVDYRYSRIGLFNNVLGLISLGFTNSQIHSYLIRADLYQAISPMETLELWRDYVDMARTIDVPYSKFPTSLKKEHDLMARNYEYQESEIIDKKFKENSKKLKHLEFKSDEYMIIVPNEARELVREGNTLRHCVASYAKRVAKGETNILFLRETIRPNVPFYTIELRDSNIYQVRGFANKHADEEVNEFINEWKREKLMGKMKLSS